MTENRQPILIKEIERLRAAFRLCLSRYPFEIEAIVVLPDHVHTLWKLPEEDRIKGTLPSRGGKTRALAKEDFSQQIPIFLQPEAQSLKKPEIHYCHV